MAKKAPVAGSVQEPAVSGTAPVALSKPEAPAAAPPAAPEQVASAEPVAAAPVVEMKQEAPAVVEVVAEQFPREITIVNDTPLKFIVAANLIGPGASASGVVRNQDEITRIQTDCKHLMSLTPAYAELDPQPLRVIDAAAE